VVVLGRAPDDVLLEQVVHHVNTNRYGLRNSLWAQDPAIVEEFCAAVTNGGILKVKDSHIGFVPMLATHGGTGATAGPFGELNYPALRTSHLQGISIAEGLHPSDVVNGAEFPSTGTGPK
jgi:hypothetical protein